MCGKEAKTRRGLTKHLTGQRRYGGHELEPAESVRRVAEAAAVPIEAPVLAAPPATPLDLPPELRAGFLFQVLERLVDNKDLPKYQFERAIDGFLSAFLPSIVESVTGGDVALVAQEFPLKKPGSNQSTNMDYVLFRDGANTSDRAWVFVELKTDPRSLNEQQEAIYATRLNPPAVMADLVDDVRQIRSASQVTAKYDELLGRLIGYPLELPITRVSLPRQTRGA